MTTPTSNIPDFKTYEEEAQFWDTHDFTDFLDELKVVRAPKAAVLQIRLQQEDLRALTGLAEQQGLGVSSLARMWIKRMLRQARAQAA